MTQHRARAHTCSAAFGLAVACLAGLSCATIASNSYVAPGTSLAGYHTYAWDLDVERQTGDPRLDNNEIFDRYMRRGIEAQLRRGGFDGTAQAAEADVLVRYHASVTQKIDLREVDRTTPRLEEAVPSVYEAGTLVVDLVEARTHRLLWRGWVEGRVDGMIDDQGLMEREVDDALDVVFKRLPARVPH